MIWITPGEKHWQGAGPTSAMTHISVGDDLYVRSVYGSGSDWFRGMQSGHEGLSKQMVSKKLSPLWKRLTLRSMIRSMLPTALSTAAMLKASSAALSALRRGPRPSNWCPAHQVSSHSIYEDPMVQM